MAPSSISEWNQVIEYAFPNFDGRVQCFAYDWLGCIFALDSGRLEGGILELLCLSQEPERR